jgi:hypothetical protein
MDLKSRLHNSLRSARQTNLSKLEGLTEYDLRRPLTPTGSNLLGILRHLGGIEHAYLCETFGRPLPPPPLPEGWEDELWHNGDMWVRSTESSAAIVTWYHEACEQADHTIQLLDLDRLGLRRLRRTGEVARIRRQGSGSSRPPRRQQLTEPRSRQARHSVAQHFEQRHPMRTIRAASARDLAAHG